MSKSSRKMQRQQEKSEKKYRESLQNGDVEFYEKASLLLKIRKKLHIVFGILFALTIVFLTVVFICFKTKHLIDTLSWGFTQMSLILFLAAAFLLFMTSLIGRPLDAESDGSPQGLLTAGERIKYWSKKIAKNFYVYYGILFTLVFFFQVVMLIYFAATNGFNLVMAKNFEIFFSIFGAASTALNFAGMITTASLL